MYAYKDTYRHQDVYFEFESVWFSKKYDLQFYKNTNNGYMNTLNNSVQYEITFGNTI